MNSEHGEAPTDPRRTMAPQTVRNADITRRCDRVCFLIFWLVAIGGDYFDFQFATRRKQASRSLSRHIEDAGLVHRQLDLLPLRVN